MKPAPLPQDQLDAVLTDFHRDGYAMIHGFLEPEEVAAIREVADRYLDDPEGIGKDLVQPVYNTPVLRNTQSIDPLFCRMLVREPFVQLAEAIVGRGFGFCGQNVIRSKGGEGIATWHTDDTLEFPLPDDVPEHNRAMRMPVSFLSFQIALSDIDCIEDGPTQIVPCTHYSGRVPPLNREDPDEANPPTWQGRGPVPMLCKAGDVYLFNHQTWHRGSPNTSGKTRYLMQNQYCQGWLVRRFANGPHRDCHLPQSEIDKLPELAKQVMRIEA